jgi:hypothetical protein
MQPPKLPQKCNMFLQHYNFYSFTTFLLYAALKAFTAYKASTASKAFTASKASLLFSPDSCYPGKFLSFHIFQHGTTTGRNVTNL